MGTFLPRDFFVKLGTGIGTPTFEVDLSLSEETVRFLVVRVSDDVLELEESFLTRDFLPMVE